MMVKLIGELINHKKLIVECEEADVDSVIDSYMYRPGGIDLIRYDEWLEQEAERLLEPREEQEV